MAFLSWLKASPVHVEEYMRITAVERALAAAANNPEVVLEDLLQEAHANLEVTPLSSTFMVSGAPPPRRARVRRTNSPSRALDWSARNSPGAKR